MENPSWNTESTAESSGWKTFESFKSTEMGGKNNAEEEADEIDDSEGEDAPAVVAIDPKLLARAREIEKRLARENEIKGNRKLSNSSHSVSSAFGISLTRQTDKRPSDHDQKDDKKSAHSSHSVATFASASSVSQCSRNPAAIVHSTPKSSLQMPRLPPRQHSKSQSKSKSTFAIPSSITATATATTEPDGWECQCGELNKSAFNFCGLCGNKKAPEPPTTWECGSCGRGDNEARFKFCVGCGTQR